MTKKLHRVFVTLELETSWPVKALRSRDVWVAALGILDTSTGTRCLQAQANRVGLSKGNPVFPRRKKARG